MTSSHFSAGEPQVPTVVCPFRGRELLNNSRYNKGTAFTQEERTKFGLHGLLPAEVVTLETQTDRIYGQYKRIDNNLTKNWLLNLLSQENEVLFFNILKHHTAKELCVIYDKIWTENI
jgi:malate dehydrogenase (oxaloacetate-decarboxylating)